MTEVCRSCGERVLTVFTAGGLLRNLHPEPDLLGAHVIIQDDQGRRALVLNGTDMPAEPGTGYRLHQCPPGRPWRRCTVCREPLYTDQYPSLAGWDTHPACDTTSGRSAVRAELDRMRAKRL